MSQILPVLLPGIVINFIIDIIHIVSRFNYDSIWLFSKLSMIYILKFHLSMDSKIFFWYNKGARYARKRYNTEDVGTI